MTPKSGSLYAGIALAVALLVLGWPTLLFSQEQPVKGSPALEEQEVKESIVENSTEEVIDDRAATGSEIQEDEEGSGLYQTVKQGGVIMIPIILLGFLSLTVIIERLIFYTKNGIWNRGHLVSHLMALARRYNASYREDMEDHLRGEFQIYVNGLERGLGILAGIGNLAPIVGFLGTVVGLIKAFASIVAATTVTAKVVAAGIQVALVTTAGGLTVAAPTLVFYYLFTTVVQNRFSAADEAISNMCAHLPRMTDSIEQDEGTDGGDKNTGRKPRRSR